MQIKLIYEWFLLIFIFLYRKQIEAEKIKAQTHIQQERDAAIADLKNHFSDLVLTATENLMRQNIDAQTDKKVIDKILNEELSKLNTN